MSSSDRWNVIRVILGIVSFFIMGFGIWMLAWRAEPIPVWYRVTAIILTQLGLVFLVSLTVGTLLQKDRARVLWDFHTGCAKAGVARFFSDRHNEAQADLERAFDQHGKGEILLTGPSLRLFLEQGHHFYEVIQRNIDRYVERRVVLKAVHCHPVENRSVAIRAFIEEFNPNGTFPAGSQRETFDWGTDPSIDLGQFASQFAGRFGPQSDTKTRNIHDLDSVVIGARQLNALAKHPCVRLRQSICAPYFTGVIFPGKCYFTPSLLSHSVPANMPMLLFVASDSCYEKICDHFRFVWWSGKRTGIGEKEQGATS